MEISPLKVVHVNVEALTLVVAVLIAYRVHQIYRYTGEEALRAASLGFSMLGVGQAALIAAILVDSPRESFSLFVASQAITASAYATIGLARRSVRPLGIASVDVLLLPLVLDIAASLASAYIALASRHALRAGFTLTALAHAARAPIVVLLDPATSPLVVVALEIVRAAALFIVLSYYGLKRHA